MKYFIFILVFVLILTSCGKTNNNNESTTSNEASTDVHTSVPDAVELEITTEEIVSEIVNNSTSGRCFYGEKTDTANTVTGLEPLEKKDFTVGADKDFSAFSTEMISHSYGVATEEKAHYISITNQQFFDEKKFDAVCLDTATTEKVVYLTFDCGYENGFTSKILDTLKKKEVKAAFFCTLPQIKDNPELVARMINEGHIVGNHSVTHPDFSTLSVDSICDELKGFDDYLRENFGYSSLYFRFPQGKYSEKSLSVINSMGYKCVFWSLAYADWDTENQKGASYALDTVMARIHPGAVMLLHSVSSDNAQALSSIIDTAREKGYDFRSLEDM